MKTKIQVKKINKENLKKNKKNLEINYNEELF